MAVGSIARRWKLLQGSNHWEGLLNPLDFDLRQNILNYGDLSQATSDAFNSERQSKYAGSSRYGRSNFFDKVGLTKGRNWGYQVSTFIYATSRINLPEAFVVKSLSREAWSRESNWMGYVAVTTNPGKTEYGRRDIAIAWRGSVQTLEWIDDFDPGQVAVSSLVAHPENLDQNVQNLVSNGSAKVQNGWFSIYTSDSPKSPFNKTSARNQVLRELKRLLDLYKDEEISITTTGHSLGAALATLCAFDIVVNGLNKSHGRSSSVIPVTAIAFASPRVGNLEFKEIVDRLPELRILRIKNNPDLVPLYPLLGYADAGEEVRIDTRKSPYVNNPGNASHWHDLEAYLHAVAGTQGTGKDFKLVIDRDISLVNKSLDWLKDEYSVPGKWWVEKNKGMVQGDDGHWLMADPLEQDKPNPEDEEL
eukprot:Gb_23531 [translate_table: standard]